MWYHYLLLLIGLYLVGSSMYNLIVSNNQAGWVLNGLSVAIGGGITAWAWNGIMATKPATATLLPKFTGPQSGQSNVPKPPSTGGRRRRY